MTKAALATRIDRDLKQTRRMLERLPDASMEWRPHARSFTLGGLATHLARLPRWGTQMLVHDTYDVATAGRQATACETRAEVLNLFDQNVSGWHDAMDASSDESLAAVWTLRRGDTVVVSMPRADAVDHFVLHHVIHHRGQLTVYLRLLDVPLLPLYGPTADEQL